MRIRKRAVRPTNCDELWEAVKEKWYKIDEVLIRDLYLSMTNRMMKLYENEGGHTKY
jgi:hypothetical protein